MTRNCLFYESQQNCFHFCRNHHLVGSRTRRSLAESNSTCINIKSNILNNNFTTIESAAASNNNANNNSNNANNNNNNEEEHPPMIGVPNLKVRKTHEYSNNLQGPFSKQIGIRPDRPFLPTFWPHNVCIFVKSSANFNFFTLPFFQLDFLWVSSKRKWV